MKKRTAIPNGQKVFVYRNLHQKCFSVKDLETGLVIAHVDFVSLTDCQLKVSESGRQRVLMEKQKNVHAGVVGTWVKPSRRKLTTSVFYNPYKYKTFTRIKEQTPILTAKKVNISLKELTAEE